MRIIKIQSSEKEMSIPDAFRTNEVASILMESAAGSGPFDGGCLIAAKALQRVYGGKIVSISSGRRGSEQVEHFGLLLPGGAVVDAAGEAPDIQAWVRRFSAAEGLDEKLSVQIGVPKWEGTPDAPDDPVAVKKLEQVLLRLLRR